jgi:hypothetical protein
MSLETYLSTYHALIWCEGNRSYADSPTMPSRSEMTKPFPVLLSISPKMLGNWRVRHFTCTTEVPLWSA